MAGNSFDSLLADFLLESRERVDTVEATLLDLEAASPEGRGELLDRARRELHTLKGNSGMMGFGAMQALAHELEDRVEALDATTPDVTGILAGVDRFRGLLDAVGHEEEAPAPDEPAAPIRPAPAAAEVAVPAAAPADAVAAPAPRPSTSSEAGERGAGAGGDAEAQGAIRVPFSALDALMDTVAEMVIFRNRLFDAVQRGHAAAVAAGATAATVESWEEVEQAREALGKTLDVVQDRVMRLRLVPLRGLFGHVRRIVHDESRREGKRVELQVAGGETPIDKALLEVASEALGHVVRNAVIHGIEDPATRRARGKPASGTVRLAAEIAGNEIRIDVVDDGGGIRRDALLASAAAKGIAVPAGADLHTLVFMSGLSTRREADLSAGRGVGMSAVGEAVARAGGRVEVTTKEGTGTRFRLRLPVSVSITRALLLRADGEEYALPLTAVVESVRLAAGDRHELNGAEVVRWRRKVLPVVDLGVAFGTADAPRSEGYLVVLEADGRQRALLVDDLTGIREIVVKRLDVLAGNPPGISGSTILGDGRAILILDPPGLVSLSPFVREAVR